MQMLFVVEVGQTGVKTFRLAIGITIPLASILLLSRLV